MLTADDELKSIDEDLRVSKSLKMLLLRIINNKSLPQENRDLARVALEKERKYEQQCLAQRGEIQKTILSRGDI